MTTNTTQTATAPNLLEERTLLGIFVHLIGLLTGILGAAIVYYATDHPFTRKNARNALNWQLLLTAVSGVAAVLGVAWIVGTDALGLPDGIAIGLFLPVFLAFTNASLLGLLNLAFVLIATVKAIFGAEWRYPLAPEFV